MPHDALHLYLLTRFSNASLFDYIMRMLYTFIYLQGSQTHVRQWSVNLRLYTFIYLQGSQTNIKHCQIPPLFYTFIYLQGSQTISPAE